VVGDARAGAQVVRRQPAAQEGGERLGAQEVRRCADARAAAWSPSHADHPIHKLHNVCMMCIACGTAGADDRRHGLEASASCRGTAPQEATMSVAMSLNRPPVATVLVAPSAGLCSVT